jgi:hypothetical protein
MNGQQSAVRRRRAELVTWMTLAGSCATKERKIMAESTRSVRDLRVYPELLALQMRLAAIGAMIGK